MTSTTEPAKPKIFAVCPLEKFMISCPKKNPCVCDTEACGEGLIIGEVDV